MQLYSTKNKSITASLKEAVFKGLPPDNGLYMPFEIPQLPNSFFENMDKMTFQEIAFEVSKALIGSDVPESEIKKIIDEVLSFEAPVIHINGQVYVLELFHGPSLAFKDFGARFMARLMSYFLSQSSNEEINILVATSGDTGSAVAQGFLNMPGIKVTILYPSGKVSDIQEKQLTTLGNNITALEIDGVFDDCQRLVKEAFLDAELCSKRNLSSANSINISRLIPQSFYYFWAYAQLKNTGNPIVFSVPSGNFGNLCGGLIAHKMGLPVEKFIAATNANDIIPSYLNTGLFKPKPSVSTISNAMDVGNPSNFQRMINLYNDVFENLKAEITGKTYSDTATLQIMKEVFEKHNYVLDPHGAIGYLGLRDYINETNSKANGVFLATAHPTKFLDIVESAIGKAIPLPERLKLIVDKPKTSIKMSASFEDFKSFLLKN